MKVLDLHCSQGHRFEGWFGSEADFTSQLERSLVECPICGDRAVQRLPSAPRLNLGARSTSGDAGPGDHPNRRGGAVGPAATPAGPTTQPVMQGGDMHALWLQVMRRVVENTEDVGERFAEEARRIHYGEVEERAIRGQATPEETAALKDEGIEVMPLPIPPSLKGPVQ